MSEISYSHRLDPRTDANLTAAILAVGNLLGVSPIADSIVEHLKDRIGDTLTPAQRINPLSIYSSDILGRLVEGVKETYGIDKPANLHAAPQGPQTKETPIGSDSVFALDALGRNRFEQLTGATSGSYARMVADAASSSAAYSAMIWNPATGVAGLNSFNFGGTPFAQNGLDLATTKYLYGQGFNQTQIIAAAQDTKALGFSAKDQKMVTNFAVMNDYDPEGREKRNAAFGELRDWRKENDATFNELRNNVLNTAEGTPEHEAALAAWQAYVHDAYKKTGMQATYDRLSTPQPDKTPEQTAAAQAAAQGTADAVLGVTDQTKQLQVKLGDDAAANATLDQRKGAAPESIVQAADQTGDHHDPATGSDASTGVEAFISVFGKPASTAAPASPAGGQSQSGASGGAATPEADETPHQPSKKLPLTTPSGITHN